MSVSMGSDNVSLAIVLRGPTTHHPDIRTPNSTKKLIFSLSWSPKFGHQNTQHLKKSHKYKILIIVLFSELIVFLGSMNVRGVLGNWLLNRELSEPRLLSVQAELLSN